MSKKITKASAATTTTTPNENPAEIKPAELSPILLKPVDVLVDAIPSTKTTKSAKRRRRAPRWTIKKSKSTNKKPSKTEAGDAADDANVSWYDRKSVLNNYISRLQKISKEQWLQDWDIPATAYPVVLSVPTTKHVEAKWLQRLIDDVLPDILVNPITDIVVDKRAGSADSATGDAPPLLKTFPHIVPPHLSKLYDGQPLPYRIQLPLPTCTISADEEVESNRDAVLRQYVPGKQDKAAKNAGKDEKVDVSPKDDNQNDSAPLITTLPDAPPEAEAETKVKDDALVVHVAKKKEGKRKSQPK